MESLLLILSLVVVHLPAVIKCSVCPTVPPLSETCCSNVIATNISDTAVLVEWTIDSKSGSGIITSVVTYDQVNPKTMNGTIETIKEHDPVSLYNGSSIVLVELREAACYLVQIRLNDSICCQEIFKTQDVEPLNQVKGVRSHRYRPVLNSYNTVAAEVTWNDASDSSTEVSSYDVRVRTADRNLTRVYRNNVTSKTLFTNIMTRNNNNEILFPLEVNKLYIVEVRGRNNSTVYSWSEPLWINTTSDYRISNLFTSGDNSGHLVRLSKRTNMYNSFVDLNINTRAIGVDNRNRVIFYFDENQSSIMKGYFDPPFIKEEVYRFTDIPMVTVTALTYDWISQRLYIAITNPLNFRKLYYIMFNSDEGGSYQLTLLRALDQELLDMSVNPFTGLIYFTEAVKNNEYQLKTIKISSPFTTAFIGGILTQSTIAQSYERSCVYAIGGNNSIVAEGSASCSDTDITLPPLTDMYVLAADEIGIFAADNSSNLYSYDQNTSETLVSQTLGLNDAALALVATSPGAQQLPEQSCLSPNILPVYVPVQVIERRSTSTFITWDPPSVGVKSDCVSMVTSLPPLMYTVEVLHNGEIIQQQTMVDTSWNITDVDPLMNYTVILRAGSSFTIGKPTMFASVVVGASDTDQGIDKPSKITVSSTSTSPTQTFLTTPTTDSSPGYDYSIILAGAVAGGVVLFTFVCTVCCCCCSCLIFRKRSKNTDEVKENGVGHKNTPPIAPTRHYFKKMLSRRHSDHKRESLSSDTTQPVYVLPGGDTPVYDINIGEQLEQYDYPQLESTPINISARSSPTGRQTGNNGTPLLTPTRKSFDHATYEYPNSAAIKSSPRLEEGRPSIVSVQSSKLSGVSNEVEDDGVYEKLDESVGDGTVVQRESHPNTNGGSEEDEYVYERLGDGRGRTPNKDSNNDDDEDGEYVYAWHGVNDSKSSPPGNSPPNSTQDNDIYETFNENHSCNPPHSISVSFTAGGKTTEPHTSSVTPSISIGSQLPSSVKSSISVGSFSSITQMPLPSLPSIDSIPGGNHDNKNKQRPKLGREAAVVDDSNLIWQTSKGNAPVDQAGYLVVTGQSPSKDNPTMRQSDSSHNTTGHHHPRSGEAPVDQAGYLVLTSHESCEEDQYDEPKCVHVNHTTQAAAILQSALGRGSSSRSSSTSSSVSADSVEDAYEIVAINK